jgi:hypothetical protein
MGPDIKNIQILPLSLADTATSVGYAAASVALGMLVVAALGDTLTTFQVLVTELTPTELWRSPRNAALVLGAITMASAAVTAPVHILTGYWIG